jgi:hypothetical protein
MAEQITDNPINNPAEPTWYQPLVGDDAPAERIELLKGYETPQAFLEDFEKTKNHDWRTDMAGDDAKFKSQLDRFSTPADMGKSFREAQATIRGGLYKQAPGPEATPDDIKAFREANGIPAEADGYFKDLPDGLVIGEEDKAIFQDFATAMHGKNVAPDTMHEVIKWYNGFAEQQQEQLAEIDHTHHQETEEALRADWGSDYRVNINMVGKLLETTFGSEAKDAILNARSGDGRAIMNIPEIVKGLADMSRKMDPLARVISPKNDPAQTLNDEIAEIEKFMRTNRAEYNKDAKMQSRLLELYDIRLEHDKRKTG